jgi:alpha/beta superfamily hydrolase
VIGRELARLGFTVILANTRGHDIATTLWKADDHSPMAGGGGSGWERMEDAPRDLAAWVDFAATLEPGGVLLAGHSKGAQKVILYVARRPHERLSGIALISPDLHGLRIPGELEAARALVAEGLGMEVVPAQPWAPWYRQSARTVVNHAEMADELPTLLASVAVPILATYGARERSGEADLTAIREQATSAPSLASEIIADGDHFYHDRETALAEVIARWATALSFALS